MLVQSIYACGTASEISNLVRLQWAATTDRTKVVPWSKTITFYQAMFSVLEAMVLCVRRSHPSKSGSAVP
jgi:hypothetical protein